MTLMITGFGGKLETTSYAYDANNNNTLVVTGFGTPNAESTFYGYDANNNVTLTITGYKSANPETTTSTYDGDNELIEQVDGAQHTSSFAYDALGDQVDAVQEGTTNGTFVSASTTDYYDDDDELTLSVDAAGHTTSYAYDADGNVTLEISGYSTTQANLADTTSFAYDKDNNNTLMITGYGSSNPETTSYAYDANNNVTLTIAGVNSNRPPESTTSYYDGDNELTLSVDALGRSSSYAYDALSDQTLAVQEGTTNGTFVAANTSDYYDADDELTLSVDAAGRSTSYAYDNDGNQSLMVTGYNTDQAETTSYAYDTDNNNTLVVTAFGTTNAESTFYGYDANNNVTVTITAYGTDDAETTTSTYDGDNELTEQVDGAQHTSSFAYDALGDQVISVQEGTTNGTSVAASTTDYYDGDDELTLSVDAAGRSTSYAYDNNGNQTLMITGYNSGNAETTSFAYDNDGNQTMMITGIVNTPSRETTSYAYDVFNNPTLSITGFGAARPETTSSAYDLDNELIAQVDGALRTSSYAYDALGDDTLAIQGVGGSTPAATTTDFYDADDELTLSVDGAGHSTSYVYDSDGNQALMITGVGSDPETTSYAYDDNNNATLVVTGFGTTSAESTFYEYDDNNNVTLTITGYGTDKAETTSSSYDGDNELTETVTGVGNDPETSSYAYDALGDQIVSTDGTGTNAATTSDFYDDDDELTLSVDGAGRSTSYEYDSDGNQTLMITGFGGTLETTSYAYDNDNNTTLMVTGFGTSNAESTSYAYDTNNNVTLSVSGFNSSHPETTSSTYDGDNELTMMVTAFSGNNPETTSYAYDSLGDQIVSIQEGASGTPVTTSDFYDGDGELTLTVVNGTVPETTSYGYDGDGNQTVMIQGYGSTVAATTQYIYDGNGNLSEEIDPDNNTTSFGYDGNGNQTIMVQAFGTTSAETTSYQYDGDGNLIEQDNPNGSRLVMTYDTRGDMLTKTLYADDGTTVTDVQSYTYDGDGNILTAGNDAGTYTFAYDADNQQTLAINPNGVTLNYQYDTDGDVTQITDSLGDTVASQYDTDGNLIERSYSGPDGAQLAVSLFYDGDNDLTGIDRYSDTAGTDFVGSASYGYDAQGNITSIVDQSSSGGSLASFSYGYDAAGELTTEVDNGTTTSYSYDAKGELVSAGTTNYSYDANGNPDQSTDSVGPNNELLSDGTWSYTYDADGNLTEKVGIAGGPDAGLTWDYTYDAENELLSATETNPSGQIQTQQTFVYDVFNNILTSSLSTDGGAPVVTHYVYNGSNLWATTDTSDDLDTFYLSGDQQDQYFAQSDTTDGTAWLLTNNLGSISTTVTNSGDPIDNIVYDAYGDVTSQTNAAEQPAIGYTGLMTFAALGLDQAGMRFYNPQTQQWMQQDPTLLQAGPNPYEYVNNAPTNATDPTGMAAQPRSLTQDATIQRILGEEQQQRLATILQSLSPAEQQKVAQWWSKLSEEVRQKYAESFRRPLSSPGRSNRELAEGLKKLPESGQPDFTKVANLEAARRRQAEQAEFDALTRRPLTSQEEFAQKIMPSVNRATAARAADLRAASNYAIANRAWLESQDKRKVIGDFLGGVSNLVLDMVPLIGEFKMGTEALAGIDLTGHELTTGQRALSVTAASLPLFGAVVGRASRLLRGTSKGGVIAKELEESWALLKAAETPEQLAKATARFEQAAAKATKELNVLNNTCFVAGTPLLTPEGEKAIEQFRPGDLVLSRSEHDVDGPVEAKIVEEVFVRVGPVMPLGVGGHTILTTPEHPFYVLGKGWRCAKVLRAGDWLVSHEGVPVQLEQVGETDAVTTVYNLRIADYHTYFVGSRGWGFSVWAHNAEYAIVSFNGKVALQNVSTGDLVKLSPLSGEVRTFGSASEAKAFLEGTSPGAKIVSAVPAPIAPRAAAGLTADEVGQLAQLYADIRNSNKAFRWRDLGRTLTEEQQSVIRNYARDAGLIRGYDKVRWYGPGSQYADFSEVAYAFPAPGGGTRTTVSLPDNLIYSGRAAHESWLNRTFFGGSDNQPVGWVWHHMAEPGQMQLVPRGVHEVAQPHSGIAEWVP